jgi:glutathione peroxidase-family protein
MIPRMNVTDIQLAGLDGTPDVLADARGKTALFVNVASKCGLTP